MTAEGLPRGSSTPREHYIEALGLLQHAMSEWLVEQRHVNREEQISTLVSLAIAHSVLGLLADALLRDQRTQPDSSLDSSTPWLYDR